MNYNTLDQLSKAINMGENFARAIEYIHSNVWRSLPEGRHTVYGDAIYVNIMRYTTEPSESKKLEAHDQYADIQMLVSGTEYIEHCPRTGLMESDAYNAESDIVFFQEPAHPTSRVCLYPGVFAVFMPEDAHKPGVQASGAAPVMKAVVKVLVAGDAREGC